jgi:hypothetical protein
MKRRFITSQSMVWDLKAPTKERSHYRGKSIASLAMMWLNISPLVKYIVEKWEACGPLSDGMRLESPSLESGCIRVGKTSIAMAWGVRSPY